MRPTFGYRAMFTPIELAISNREAKVAASFGMSIASVG
jgi:hypothetical protein